MSTLAQASKGYWKLVRRFPLRAIRSDEELDIASEIFSELGMKGNSRTQDEQDYMDILGQLIARYESTSPAIQALLAEAAAIPRQDILRSFMTDHGLTQLQLAREIGIDQGHLSAFLCGKRGLSKASARKLADRFKVSIDLFLP